MCIQVGICVCVCVCVYVCGGGRGGGRSRREEDTVNWLFNAQSSVKATPGRQHGGGRTAVQCTDRGRRSWPADSSRPGCCRCSPTPPAGDRLRTHAASCSACSCCQTQQNGHPIVTYGQDKMRLGVTGWLNWYSVGLKIQRNEV